jgi:hypothetical protein
MKIIIEFFSCIGCYYHQEDGSGRDRCYYHGDGDILWNVDEIPDDCPARKDAVK